MIEIRDSVGFNDFIESLLEGRESDEIEFKSAAGGFPGSFWETYSAFANSSGGLIILGVAEKGGKFSLDGLTDEQIDKYQKDFWSTVNNRSNVSCNLLKSGDVTVREYKGHKMLSFYIPRAERQQRPIFRTKDPFNGTFKRNFEGDYKCTESEVRRMFADADDSHPADSRILKNYSMDDIDKETLNKYRQQVKSASPDHPWLSLDDLELLRTLGGYRKDRQTNEEGFTVAGLLMFGKSASITDVECCPYFFPDYQEHLTEDENIRWTNRICPDGTWEANLFNFYLRVLPRLQTVLPKPFRLENNIRKDETPAHIAVREALTNLCVHADYSINSSLVVIHNTNGFVFSNPGSLLVSKEQYYAGGESVCRNKSLQKMFSILGIAEQAGSGSGKIIKGWRDSNWRSPKVEEIQHPDKVVLSMPMESLLSEKTKKELTSIFGIAATSFDHNTSSILALASEEGFVTNERLRYSMNMHRAQISDLLKLMVQKKILEPQGHGRGMRYYLPKNSLNIIETNITSPQPNITSSESNLTSSDPNIACSRVNITSSEANVPSTADSATDCINPLVKALLNKKRLPEEKLFEVVEFFCSDWISMDDLATVTRRSTEYLRVFIVPKMLKMKRLEMMYPGTAKHPKQKYKVKTM